MVICESQRVRKRRVESNPLPTTVNLATTPGCTDWGVTAVMDCAVAEPLTRHINSMQIAKVKRMLHKSGVLNCIVLRFVIANDSRSKLQVSKCTGVPDRSRQTGNRLTMVNLVGSIGCVMPNCRVWNP